MEPIYLLFVVMVGVAGRQDGCRSGHGFYFAALAYNYPLLYFVEYVYSSISEQFDAAELNCVAQNGNLVSIHNACALLGSFCLWHE